MNSQPTHAIKLRQQMNNSDLSRRGGAYAIQPVRKLIDLQTRRVEAYAIQLMLKQMLYNEWRVEPMQSNQ